MAEEKWWESKVGEEDLADFDSDDFELDEDSDEEEDSDDGAVAAIGGARSVRNEYIGGLWGQYGYADKGRIDHAMAVVTAHEMVQTFVDTFTLGDTRYRVTFDPKVSTAGTDLAGHAVLITPSPIYDTSLTPQQAGILLTAMAVHEVSHVRYGRSTAAAVRRAFGNKPAANIISNLLDDVRIERRFSADYPGYRDVFYPMLKYVAETGAKKYGPSKPKLSDPINVAIAAVRYNEWAIWTATTAPERDWWRAWAERWAKEDAPRRHVEGVREALRRIAAYPRVEKTKQPSGGTGQGDGSGSSESFGQEGVKVHRSDVEPDEDDEENALGADRDDEESERVDNESHVDPYADFNTDKAEDASSESDGEPMGLDDYKDEETLAGADPSAMSDEDLSNIDVPEPTAGKGSLPVCAADGVEDSARENGAKFGDHVRKQAERDVRAAEFVEDAHTDATWGRSKIGVCRSIKGLKLRERSRYDEDPEVSGAAAAVIRNALLRSRTGHTGLETHQSRGRLDNKSLYRIASQDPRLFHRRIAPDPGRYLLWIMVDVSGSMSGRPVSEAASVARALADASSGTPSIRMAVWGWSDPFLREQQRIASAGVAKVWESGQPTSEVFKITRLSMGGTPDVMVLSWAWRAILKECRSDEKPMIVMCSDGQGYRGMDGVVADARKHGVEVRSVSFGWGVNEDYQEKIYGRGKFIPWEGSILATARPLATMIGKLVTT